MGRLVFFLVGVADEHAAQADKGQLAVLVVGPKLDLRQRLVGEACRHHEARVAGGATEVHKTTLRQKDDAVAVLPRKNGLPKVAPVKMSPQAASLHIDREGPQTTIIFGTQGIDFDDPDFFPAYVMNLALAGGGLSTILGEEIREKRGLA